MVSSAIWDVAYFYFGEKLDWRLFCICYIRNLELLNKSLTGSDVDSNAIDFFSPFRPFFSNLAPGVLSRLAPLPSITGCPYRCLARHRSRKQGNTPTISQGTLQSCLTPCDPMDHSPPDSSVHGILQVRILEWAVIPFYKGSSQPQDRTRVSMSPALASRFFRTSTKRTLSSVQFSCSVVSDSLRPHESQHARPPRPSPPPGVHRDPRPSSRWCHPAISSSVIPFSSCPQSLPTSESFPVSQLFAWGGQSTGVSLLEPKSKAVSQNFIFCLLYFRKWDHNHWRRGIILRRMKFWDFVFCGPSWKALGSFTSSWRTSR